MGGRGVRGRRRDQPQWGSRTGCFPGEQPALPPPHSCLPTRTAPSSITINYEQASRHWGNTRSDGDAAVYGGLLEVESLHAVLDVPLGLLGGCEVDLPGGGVGEVLAILAVTDEDVLLDLGLLDQPLLGIRCLHQPVPLPFTHHVHISQGTQDMHPETALSLPLLMALLYDLESPPLVHPQIPLEDNDLPFPLPRSITEVETPRLIISEDEDGVLQPVDIEHSRAIQPEELTVLPLAKLRRLQHPLQSQNRPRVILDPHESVLPREDLKFLTRFHLPRPQLRLEVLNGEDEVGLDVDDLKL